MNEPKKKKSLGTILLILVAVGVGGICLIGILAAIAVPSFISYMRRAKTAEATSNVGAIYIGIEARASNEGAAPITSIPRTPSEVPCGVKTMWPSDAPAGWNEIGFSPGGPVHYAYELEAYGDGTFVIRATGDLDCDGTLAVFEQRGRIDPTTRSAVRDGEVVATNEME